MSIRRRLLLFPITMAISTLLLTGCHRPERIQAVQDSDSILTCPQIRQEIDYAEQAKLAAREHDKFEFRYMLVIPAFVSAYNFHRAEQAADARKATLEQIYAAKNCAG